MNKLILLFSLVLLASCTQEEYQSFSYRGEAFGTTYSIVVISKSELGVQQKLDSVVTAVNHSMSTYDPTSDISRINKGESKVEVDAMFVDVFTLSKKINQNTAGFFDPTVGTLVNAWGFGPESGIAMNADKVDSLMNFVGLSKVELIDHRIVKQTPEIYIDFNAIAKGYAIDRIGAMLNDLGIENYLVEVGGEILTRGTHRIKNKAWVVGIDDPQAEDRNNPIRLLYLTDKALASSGNYRKFRVDPTTGEKYVHTINPMTGFTQNARVLAASVIADDCATADAYATAFMAMGLEKAQEVLAMEQELEAFIVYLDDNNQTQTWTSAGFQTLLLSN